MLILLLHKSEGLLTYFLLILDTFRPIFKVSLLNNTDTVFTVFHCDFYLVILSIGLYCMEESSEINVEIFSYDTLM